MFIVGFISGDHHRFGLAQSGSASLSGCGLLSLMFVFDVGVESWIAEISLAAHADVVSFHGIISGSSFSSGNEFLLAFKTALLWVIHSGILYIINDLKNFINISKGITCLI